MAECPNRTNQHILVPKNTLISYESVRTPTHFSLPRVYTTTHNDDKAQVYIYTGSSLNDEMLAESEPVTTESQVVGKWVGNKQIHLTVIVSSQKNPLAEVRNTIFCKSMSMVLEGIALSEQGLMLRYPELGDAKIYITFKSIDKSYQRTECWGRLRRWS